VRAQHKQRQLLLQSNFFSTTGGARPLSSAAAPATKLSVLCILMPNWVLDARREKEKVRAKTKFPRHCDDDALLLFMFKKWHTDF
jgi:hypothetical protein